MSTNIVNIDPYLRTHWHFTQDAQLVTELTRSFNEVAIVMNMRTIGTYALNMPAITGNQWFISGSNRQQQSLRQVMTTPITSATSYPITIPHNIPNLNKTGGVVNGFGSVFDGTNWYGLIFGSSTAIAAQYSFFVTPTNVVILQGAAAPNPPIGVTGLITLVFEWISQV